jgi:deazaflavin-dependent oxidoreductase (nitroreductase family)
MANATRTRIAAGKSASAPTAQDHTLTATRKLANWRMRWLLRFGLAPVATYLLTVPGRRTGIPRSTPVKLVIEGDQRWLVALFGDVNWVLNARAAGQVSLSRGRRTEDLRVAELGPDEAAPVLKMYLARFPFYRSFFDTSPDAPVAAFAAEASRHPVFRIVGLGTA